MNGNSYSSPVPTEISALPSLERLFLQDGNLSGDLSFLQDMRSIKEVHADRNQGLAGEIPTEVGTLTTLEVLSFKHCSLTGALPSELGLLTTMQKMWFYANALTGTVPSELGNLSALQLLEIEMNNISGTMPQEVCDLRDVFAGGLLGVLEADCVGEIECDCCTACFGTARPSTTPYGTTSPTSSPTIAPSAAPSSAPVQPTFKFNPPPTAAPVAEASAYTVLTRAGVTGGKDFDDSASYEANALLWLAKSQNLRQLSNERILQRFALACLYFGTNGVANPYTDATPPPQWLNSKFWVTETDECLWYGITCDTEGKVTSIVLVSRKCDPRCCASHCR